MRYMLLVHTAVDGAESAPAQCAEDPGFHRYLDAIKDRVVAMDGGRLRPPADATHVRARGGEVLISDGPFAEAKEYLAGFDLIDVADLDEAVELAALHPAAVGNGTVEVRPLWD